VVERLEGRNRAREVRLGIAAGRGAESKADRAESILVPLWSSIVTTIALTLVDVPAWRSST